jgi:extradiol dioxygenase family protein
LEIDGPAMRDSRVLTPFHIAIQVQNIEEAREFYSGILGCKEGRKADGWADFDLFGHQLVCHENRGIGRQGKIPFHVNAVDGYSVPVPHYGVVLSMGSWHELAARLRSKGVEFLIEPYIRFAGEPGEQATMFFLDPSGNALEFKAFNNIETQLFAT